MDPSSPFTATKLHHNTVANLDARSVHQSQGNIYNADNGAKIEINTGARITINTQNPSPEKEELPPLPRCPAPCSGYVRRKALEDHMSSYFFQGPSQHGHRRKRFVLHGLGGSGKTQGALNFIDANFYSLEPKQRKFSEAYWVDATTVGTITKSLKDIALSVGMSKAEDALTLLASLNVQSNWIMLYNNADDPSLDLTNYFPKCTHGNIIITTRNCEAARYGLGPGSDYAVSGMEYDEAKELFIGQARLFNANSATMQVVDQLIAELSYFPLSVRQSGAYIFATSCTPADYLERFQTRRRQLLRKHDQMSVEDYQYGTVEATLSLSFARLSSAAQRLLQLFAWFHREYILEKILQDGFSGLRRYKRYYRRLATKDEKRTIASLNQFRENLISGGRLDIDKLRGLLAELKSFSLVISIPEQQSYSIHTLVQEWTRGAIDKGIQRLVWGNTSLLLGSAIGLNRANTTESLSFLRGLVPHVDEILKGAMECFDGCKTEFGDVYKQTGRWSEEMELREGYNEICQKILGQQHLESLTSVDQLARTYYCRGKYDKVAKMYLEVLEFRRAKLGVNHPFTLSSMNNLALVYSSQGRYEKAAEMQLVVLGIKKVKLGIDHPSILISMNNLASVYHSQGKYEKAAEMQSEVLEIRKVKLGIDHPETLILMNNLAETHRSQGKYEKAAEIHSEVLEICKVLVGIDHPNTLSSMNNLASAYRSQGKYERAAEMYSKALEIRSVKLGVDHPDTLASMNNLALTYDSQGKYDRAAEMHSDVLETRKMKLGVDHPDTLISMNNLAEAYCSQGKYEKAAEMHFEVLEISKVKLGVDHPNTLISMNNLASTYGFQGKYEKAVDMHSEVLKISRVKLGVDHPNTLVSMNNLASVYGSQGKYDKAIEMHSEVLKISGVKLGVDHPTTLASMSNLARSHLDLHDLDNAAELFSQLIELETARFGVDHPETRQSIQRLQSVLELQSNVVAPVNCVPASLTTEDPNVHEFSSSHRITQGLSAASKPPIALQPIGIPDPAVQEPLPQPSFPDQTPTPAPSTPIAGCKTCCTCQ